MIQQFVMACSVEGRRLILPSRNAFELDPATYGKFKKLIQAIGGDYHVGSNSFDFDFEPGELLLRLSQGENYAQALQFFPTPPAVCAQVESVTPRRGGRWLEPSAGRGALVDVIRKANEGLQVQIDTCELDNVNRLLLERKGVNLVGGDFLQYHTRPGEKYDGIVMNPPFSNGQYMKHILRAYDHLKPGGSLTFIAPTEWLNPVKQVHQDFHCAITASVGVLEVLPKRAFKESGTAIDTVLVGMHRPLYDYSYHYQPVRKQPVWACTLEEEALAELGEYFAVIDQRGPADISLYDVRMAASNLGLPHAESFCEPIHAALTNTVLREPAPVTVGREEYVFDF
jgi:hypothetical protein